MSSRKEEERNEKIIRGLMKLPPNRRCINCNNMGPQYVCINFWTFVCMTCSGIHREFTHRVKSVSMAKFTSQEVEALQKGGNQRAREIFLTNWDTQRHRLPDNSNSGKIREFIKSVYLDKKYVGRGSSDRPPRDMQNGRSHDEEGRRASSYHSFSQSPPYDFQYEERRYGKHAPVLTRKPGSDRGLYDGKISSFLSPSHLSDRSPSRLSDHMYEDSFANERSNSRISDYSASSGGDPFRSNIQSPNSQRDIGSPSSETSRDFSSDVIKFTGNPNPDSHARRSFGQMLHPQRTASLGSFGSFDSKSFKSVNSVSLVDAACGHEQPVEAHNYKKSTLPSPPQSSISGTSDGLDLFNAPFAAETVAVSTLAGNVSQLPGLLSNQLVDLLQPSPTSTASTFSTHQQPQPMLSSSLDMIPTSSSQPTAAIFSDKPLHFMPQNEGWATFETPQHLVPLSAAASTAAEILASDANSLGDFNPLYFAQWPSFQDNSAHGPSSVMPPMWNAGVQKVEALQSTTSTEYVVQSWNAFEDSCGKLGESREQVTVHQSSFPDQYLSTESKEIEKGGIPAIGRESLSAVSNGSLSPNISLMPHYSSVLPAGYSHALERKSTNPFDLPDDAEINCEDMSQFLEMSALQAALPSFQAPSPFTTGANEHWFAQDPIAPYVHAGSEGAFGFSAGHAQSSKISNVSSQGPVGSVGGNPFA